MILSLYLYFIVLCRSYIEIPRKLFNVSLLKMILS
nr:MAG TPA: hypothetical protein [Bacteriophage sp.]